MGEFLPFSVNFQLPIADLPGGGGESRGQAHGQAFSPNVGKVRMLTWKHQMLPVFPDPESQGPARVQVS